MSSKLNLVVGLGKTGYSIARYLSKRKLPFVMFDTRQNPNSLENFSQEFPLVEVTLEKFPEKLYKDLSAIIISPGISLEEPFIQKAIELGIPIYGDIECLAREVKVPLVAITGTNGKSTVTTLVGEMAKSSGLSAAVAGNIGLPVLDILDIDVKYDVWILELSSFQLEVTNSLRPLVATILNITPDHLDRHNSFENYVNTKQRVYRNANTIVYNREDKITYPQVNPANTISYGLDEPNENNWGIISHQGKNYIARGNEKLIPLDELKIKGKHNWLNALAACALAQTIGVTCDEMVKVLQRFPGLPHRSQWVRTIDGVDWINDSKGTNVGATISAISGIGSFSAGKIILIAGGQAKGADFSALKPSVLEFARCVVLIGEDALKIENDLGDGVEILHAPSLETAIQMAKDKAQSKDVVVLSPACASFDMFRDFNHRGDEFISLVNSL